MAEENASPQAAVESASPSGEVTPVAPAAPAPEAASGGAAGAEAPAEEKPRTRRRARKTAEGAATAEGAEGTASEAPKPKRGRRRAAAAEDAPAAPEAAAPAAAPVSDEVAQARALAQVSQAQVARRQRRAQAKAADVIAAPEGGAPAPAEDASPAAAAGAVPLVDPALRPHRRGRKPKAYVEAERAAAAALAAAEAAAAASQGTDAAPAASAPASDDAPAGEAAAADVKPGRARRAKAAKATKASRGAKGARGSHEGEAAPTPEDAAVPAAAEGGQAAPAPEASSHDAGTGAGTDKPAKRERAAEGVEGTGRTRGARRTHAAEDRAHAAGAGDRRDNAGDRRDKRQRDRKQRNNRYNVPTEPTLSREDLAAMKVAELREKARELELDPTGKKKPELVEEVYLAAARAEGFRDVEGILEIANEGFGHLRVHGYMQSRDDAFVPANLIRAARLRPGDHIVGSVRPSRANDKYPALAKIQTVNGRDPEELRVRPKFSDLTPIYPNEPLKMEHGKDSITGRAIDIVAPVGKGQRGLIVSPPKAGKTTILKKICQAITINNPEVHVICLLVDERPEEVTDMQRSIKGEVVASTFDMPADNHTRVAELVIERAKRIVEMGGDVVVVLDSITRLARAYNLAAPASGRILSGGVDSAALYPPKRFLGAARNIENGGSLTILASALVDTGSKMDEVIFEEFKGTGNMELKLDRDLADRRIFPAIDPVASGTRNEDLLIDEQMRPFVWGIRRVLASMNNTERAASAFIKGLRGTSSNSEFLIRSAKRAQEHGDLMP